jgi:hypothetical protein
VINDELRAIQSVLNETARASNEGAVPVTLVVDGQVIAGFIVSQTAYQRARETSAVDGLTKRVALALNKVDSASPEASRSLLHIYLRGATFLLSGVHLGGTIMKLAIDAIDGFMFGIEGDEAGLVLSGSPVLPGSSADPRRKPNGPGLTAVPDPVADPTPLPLEPQPSATRLPPAPSSSTSTPAEASSSRPEFVEILRRVTAAVEASEAFRLLIDGGTISIPAQTELVIRHDTEAEYERLDFEIRWRLT